MIGAGERFEIRDFDGGFLSDYFFDPIPIVVLESAIIDARGLVQVTFQADDWNSTMQFAPGIPVSLGGSLELTFTDDVDPATQVGRTLHIFDWTGVSPTGQFAIRSPYVWDTTNLYTTGEVTLIAVPEPAAFVLMSMVLPFRPMWRRGKRRRLDVEPRRGDSRSSVFVR